MKKGFTALELLLSIAIIAVIMAASIPFYFSFYAKSKNESLTKEILSSIYRTKLKAMASENDDSWGLAIAKDSKITIFRGTNYSTRNQLYDEVVDIESGTAFTSSPEIIFAKSSGLTDTAKTISFTDSNNNTITINIDTYGNASLPQ